MNIEKSINAGPMSFTEAGRVILLICSILCLIVFSACSSPQTDDAHSPRLLESASRGGCSGGEDDQYIQADLTFDKAISVRKDAAEEIRITIGGESAGGASVINMLVCPGAKGCFTQAIVESGLPNCVMTHQTARENIDLFLEGMHWTEKDMAAHLRNDDPHMFLLGHEYVQAKHQYKNPGMFLPGPVIDDLLPVRPIDALRAGAAEGIRLIIGTNMHEGTMFVHPENTGFPNSWTMVAEMLEKNGNTDALPGIIGYYHEDGKDYFRIFKDSAVSLSSSTPPLYGDERQVGGDAFIRFSTDYAFEMPAVKVAKAQAGYTKDVWMYRFELITKSGIATGWKASHAFELPAVFEKPHHPFSHFEFDGEEPEVFENISRDMHGDWVRFMKTGSPDPEWERFTGDISPVKIYDRKSRTEILDRSQLMKVWGDYRFYED